VECQQLERTAALRPPKDPQSRKPLAPRRRSFMRKLCRLCRSVQESLEFRSACDPAFSFLAPDCRHGALMGTAVFLILLISSSVLVWEFELRASDFAET